MKHFFCGTGLTFACLFFFACGSNSNDRSVKLEDLDKTIKKEKQEAPPGAARSTLTANELIELYGCKDLPCVQLFMKDRSRDFVHAEKGEFASLYRSAVTDTSGQQLVIPMSTLYVSVDPGADWRMAHTLHTKALSDQLLHEFAAAKFMLADSVYKPAHRAFAYYYRSSQYPGLVLYHIKTFSPWRARGLYYNVTWPCFVFELFAG